jgi:hypothetical protein
VRGPRSDTSVVRSGTHPPPFGVVSASPPGNGPIPPHPLEQLSARRGGAGPGRECCGRRRTAPATGSAPIASSRWCAWCPWTDRRHRDDGGPGGSPSGTTRTFPRTPQWTAWCWASTSCDRIRERGGTGGRSIRPRHRKAHEQTARASSTPPAVRGRQSAIPGRAR